MRKKKNPKNGYYFFMLEKKGELEAQGRRFPGGMKDVAIAVAEDWKNLPAEKREHYTQLARGAKGQDQSSLPPGILKQAEGKIFTPIAESCSADVTQRILREEDQAVELKAKFYRIVHGNPINGIFVVMHVIPSCEVAAGMGSVDYYPLEIAVAAFNFKDGLLCTYWSLIDTVKVPAGYGSAVKRTSEDTALPQPGSSIFQKEAPDARNYDIILANIRRFVETWCAEYPGDDCLVFAMDDNIPKLRGSLNWLYNNSTVDKNVSASFLQNLKFYSLPSLVIELAVLGSQMNPSYRSDLSQFRLIRTAEKMLGTSCFDYREELTCQYHNKEDYVAKTPNCCLNFLLRRVFIMLEEFCRAFSCTWTDRHRIPTFLQAAFPEHLRDWLPLVATNAAAIPDSSAQRRNGFPLREVSYIDVESDNNGRRNSSGSFYYDKSVNRQWRSISGSLDNSIRRAEDGHPRNYLTRNHEDQGDPSPLHKLQRWTSSRDLNNDREFSFSEYSDHGRRDDQPSPSGSDDGEYDLKKGFGSGHGRIPDRESSPDNWIENSKIDLKGVECKPFNRIETKSSSPERRTRGLNDFIKSEQGRGNGPSKSTQNVGDMKPRRVRRAVRYWQAKNEQTDEDQKGFVAQQKVPADCQRDVKHEKKFVVKPDPSSEESEEDEEDEPEFKAKPKVKKEEAEKFKREAEEDSIARDSDSGNEEEKKLFDYCHKCKHEVSDPFEDEDDSAGSEDEVEEKKVKMEQEVDCKVKCEEDSEGQDSVDEQEDKHDINIKQEWSPEKKQQTACSSPDIKIKINIKEDPDSLQRKRGRDSSDSDDSDQGNYEPPKKIKAEWNGFAGLIHLPTRRLSFVPMRSIKEEG